MNNRVSIFFAGDFCSTSSTTPIKVSKELVEIIDSCDFAVCNFEVPLKPDVNENSPEYKNVKKFNNNDDVPEFLNKIGFNLFSIATNHTFDWGNEGFLKTKAVFGDNCFGAGTYKEAYSLKIVEKEGIKIGFLALCYSAYRGVFNDVAQKEGYGCAYVNDLKVNHIIHESKKTIDFLILLVHDGIEYVDIPTPETIEKYRDFIEWGADAVIGTHPHCPQGWEKYKNGLIFYSLGNFYFNSKEGYSYRVTNCPHWYDGLCIKLTLNPETKEIEYTIVNTKNVDNLKIEIDKNPEREIHNSKLCEYLKDKAKYKECYRQQISTLITRYYNTSLPFFMNTLSGKQKLKLTIRYITDLLGNKVRNGVAVERIMSNDTIRLAVKTTLKIINSNSQSLK